MNNLGRESLLIFPDIADIMHDYVPIQLDIDTTKIKAAALLTQRLDLFRLIGQKWMDCVTIPFECVGDVDALESDDARMVRQLLEAPYVYYTYSRLILLYNHAFTESGAVLEEEAIDFNEAKKISNHWKSVAESLMEDVLHYIQCLDEPDKKICPSERVPGVIVIGGEFRSNGHYYPSGHSSAHTFDDFTYRRFGGGRFSRNKGKNDPDSVRK